MIEDIPTGAVSKMLVLAMVPLSVAVRLATWLSVRTPVETTNVAVVAFTATVTEAGAVNAGDALFVRVTTVAATGAEERVTVHVVPPFDVRLAAVQVSIVTVTGACRDIVAVALVPLSDPVSVAVWLTVRVPVDTLNVAVVAFAATVTEAGAVNAGDALFVRVTAVVLVGAFDNVTVQVVLPFDANAVAVQVSDVMVATGCSDILTDAVVPLSDPVRVAV